MQWHVPVVPATQNADARGSLEPRSLRLHAVSYDHTIVLHPAWVTEQDPVSKKEKNEVTFKVSSIDPTRGEPPHKYYHYCYYFQIMTPSLS